MTDDQAVTYGREAAAVLGNRAYSEAFEAVDRALWEAATKTGQSDEYRIRLLLCAEMGKQYRKYLEKAMADGKFAAESIKQEEQRKRWFSRAA